jgi:DNA-directed RNA polymerase III subunit RPC2
MGKQAIGAIGYNQLNRVDTLLYLMTYPQRPLVQTRTVEITNLDKLPAGQNASVAIMSYSGYDIEDAVILNRGSLDRGFGRALYVRRYQTEVQKYPNNTMDQIRGVVIPPEKHKQQLFKRFHALDEGGIARVAEKLSNGDVIVNKYCPTTQDPNQPAVQGAPVVEKQKIESYKGANPAYVDRVILTTDPANEKNAYTLKFITR